MEGQVRSFAGKSTNNRKEKVMAVTNTGDPGANHGAFNPVEWTFTSSRYDGSTNQFQPDGHAPQSTWIRVYEAAGHNFLNNDIVTGSGFTNSNLNGVFLIAYVNAQYFDIAAITWTADMVTDLNGWWTRTNNNFFMSLQVKVGGTTKATKYAEPDASDDFIFDIAKQLQTILAEDGGGKAEKLLTLATTALTTGNDGCKVKHTLVITEHFDDEDGQIKDGTPLTITTLSGDDIIAYNLALQSEEAIADYLMASGTFKAFLTAFPGGEKLHADTYLQIPFITTETAVYCKVVQTLLAGGTNDIRIPAAGTVTVTDRHCILPIAASYLVSTVDYVTITVYNSGDTKVSEDLVIDLNHTSLDKDTKLLFKGHLGGFDSYTFVERQETNKDKRDRYKVDGVEKTFRVSQETEWLLLGQPEKADILAWLQDLYNSDSIYRIAGSYTYQVNKIKGSNITEGFAQEMERPAMKVNLQPLKLNN